MAAFIGTSGWAYREWKPAFYRADLPQREFLRHYATRLTACEINATHYRLQDPATVARWAADTPDDFRFTAKVHRRLTHGRSPVADDAWHEFLDRFMAQLAPLEDKLVALRLEIPSERDDGALERLLDALAPGPTPVLDFRHPSWLVPEVIARTTEAGAVCLDDMGGPAPERLPPGPVAYLRLRGESYSEPEREARRALIVAEAVERDVLVFTRHKDLPAGDPACGIGLAEWLRTRL